MSVQRREYPRCAKCGEVKPLDSNYVHEECRGPGGYRHCAVCGREMEPGRCYVCSCDLARPEHEWRFSGGDFVCVLCGKSMGTAETIAAVVG